MHEDHCCTHVGRQLCESLRETHPLHSRLARLRRADLRIRDQLDVATATALPPPLVGAAAVNDPVQPRRLRACGRIEPRERAEGTLASWRWSRGYVENVADAVVLAAMSPAAAGLTYNVAPIETLTEHEWIEAIAEAYGWEGKVVAAPPQALPENLRAAFDTDQHIVLDSTRIRSGLDYAESVSLRDALQQTVEWERANPPLSPPSGPDYEAEDAVLARLRAASAPTE